MERFITLVRKYKVINELTPTIINEFIDKILVHEPSGTGAERSTEIEVYLNYIGQFKVPEKTVQMTKEERIEAERHAEKLRRKRESNRKYMKKIRERTKEFKERDRIADAERQGKVDDFFKTVAESNIDAADTDSGFTPMVGDVPNRILNHSA